MFHGCVRAFDETARAGSIRKASEALGVAPSSVSRHIAMLERQMGTALFVRRADGVDLTHAGKLVAEYTRSVLMDYDTLRADLDDIRGTQRRLLRLGMVESVASCGPMVAIGKFSEKFPSVSFNVRLMPAPLVAQAVRQGQCEIGLAYCIQPDPEIVTLASIAEPIMLAVRSDHPLSSARQVSIKDLVDISLGLPDQDFGVRQIIDRAAAILGVSLAPVLSSNDFQTLRNFVRCGAGAALLPMRAISPPGHAGGLRSIAVEGPEFSGATIDLIVLRKRRLPRVIRTFVDELIAEITSDTGLGAAP